MSWYSTPSAAAHATRTAPRARTENSPRLTGWRSSPHRAPLARTAHLPIRVAWQLRVGLAALRETVLCRGVTQPKWEC